MCSSHVDHVLVKIRCVHNETLAPSPSPENNNSGSRAFKYRPFLLAFRPAGAQVSLTALPRFGALALDVTNLEPLLQAVHELMAGFSADHDAEQRPPALARTLARTTREWATNATWRSALYDFGMPPLEGQLLARVRPVASLFTPSRLALQQHVENPLVRAPQLGAPLSSLAAVPIATRRNALEASVGAQLGTDSTLVLVKRDGHNYQ
jgi:hypothetical protein